MVHAVGHEDSSPKDLRGLKKRNRNGRETMSETQEGGHEEQQEEKDIPFLSPPLHVATLFGVSERGAERSRPGGLGLVRSMMASIHPTKDGILLDRRRAGEDKGLDHGGGGDGCYKQTSRTIWSKSLISRARVWLEGGAQGRRCSCCYDAAAEDEGEEKKRRWGNAWSLSPLPPPPPPLSLPSTLFPKLLLLLLLDLDGWD